ncbi:beta-ketoacyl synthase chain length factor [Catenulispora subtropica]|uniref:Beta-ketoacyl synthase-like N-terminal domain-containing protein n=1 Tax=Catenulispora subtropica TaxID=450798 RepID=A0ABN2SEQ2_9ACTN
MDHAAVVSTVAAPQPPAVIAVAPVTDTVAVIPVAPATEAGLAVVAEARWPESERDQTPPALPGFIVSSFSPIAAETAARCLSRRPTGSGDGSATAVIIASARGDLESAAHVAEAVDSSGTLGPLLFFQSVPNAVAGHIAARWNLTGPVVCVADRASALEAAALLIEDGDADEALVLHIDGAAHAVLLRAESPGDQQP